MLIAVFLRDNTLSYSLHLNLCWAHNTQTRSLLSPQLKLDHIACLFLSIFVTHPPGGPPSAHLAKSDAAQTPVKVRHEGATIRIAAESFSLRAEEKLMISHKYGNVPTDMYQCPLFRAHLCVQVLKVTHPVHKNTQMKAGLLPPQFLYTLKPADRVAIFLRN